MCQKCERRREALLRDIKRVMDPNTPPEELPYVVGPYTPEMRDLAIQVVREFHMLALYNSFLDMRLNPEDPKMAGAIKRIRRTADEVIAAMPDNDLGRLVFFQAAYDVMIALDPVALITQMMTRNDKGYYAMPEGVGTEILGLFPQREILQALLADVMASFGVKKSEKKPDMSQATNFPPSAVAKEGSPKQAAEALFNRVKGQTPTGTKVEDLGDGVSVASFGSFDGLIEFMERGGLSRRSES